MAIKPTGTAPTWTDLKQSLAGFDRPGLLGLVQDLYTLGRDNQAFLHARFGRGQDVPAPYKAVIERALSSNYARGQPPSVARAKKAIGDYKRAVGQPEGVAELMVFFCERAADSAREHGLQGIGYFDTLVRIVGQALAMVATLPDERRRATLNRLRAVRDVCDGLGYRLGHDMDRLLAKQDRG